MFSTIKQFHGYDLLFLRAPRLILLESEVTCLVTKVGTLAVFNLEVEELNIIKEALPGFNIPDTPIFLKITNATRYFNKDGEPLNELPTKGTFAAKLSIMVKGKKGDMLPIWSAHQVKVLEHGEQCIL